MKTTIFFVAAIAFTASCTKPSTSTVPPTSGAGAPSATLECDLPGIGIAMVRYDETQIRVPNSNVKQGRKLIFKLHPGSDYEGSEVTIKGKESDAAAAWINVSGSYTSSDGELAVCVDEDQPIGDYLFTVNVAGLGYIDPRARVDPR